MERVSERVLDLLEWPFIVDQLSGCCTSEPGKKCAGSIKPVAPVTSTVPICGLGCEGRSSQYNFSEYQSIINHKYTI